MSYKSRDNQKIAISNQPDPIRKTILRNPEVPFGSQILSKSTNDLPRQQLITWHKELSHSSQKPTTSRLYHEPRLNKLTEMRKSLNEIKMYEAKTLEGVHDLTKDSQRLANREVKCLQTWSRFSWIQLFSFRFLQSSTSRPTSRSSKT